MWKYVLIFLINSTLSARLPENIKKCSKSDPNLGECVKESAIAAFHEFISGYKPLGIQALEPMSISELSTEGSGGLKQVYKNIKIKGLSKCIIKNMDLDLKKLTMDMEAACPHSEMIADYSLKGQLVTFPIDSSGKCEILFDELVGSHKTKLERFEKNGKKYIRFKDWKMKLTPRKVHLYYENIIPDNKQLSETILKTLNENSVQIFLEQATGFEEGYAAIHKAIANQVLEKIPEDELFLS